MKNSFHDVLLASIEHLGVDADVNVSITNPKFTDSAYVSLQDMVRVVRILQCMQVDCHMTFPSRGDGAIYLSLPGEIILRNMGGAWMDGFPLKALEELAEDFNITVWFDTADEIYVLDHDFTVKDVLSKNPTKQEGNDAAS